LERWNGPPKTRRARAALAVARPRPVADRSGPGARAAPPAGDRRSGFLGGFGRGLLGPVDQLDQRHRGIVAHPEAELQDAQVTAVAGGEARAELVEKLDDHLAVAQAVEGQAAVRQRRLLAQRDDRLDYAAQF